MSSTVLVIVFFGLAAALSWGLADFFAAKASRTIGPVTSVVAVNIIGFTAFAAMYILTRHQGSFEAPGVWYAIAGGLFQGLGQISFFQGLKVGPVSLVSPLSGAYPLVTTLGMLLFFHAQLSALQIIGIVTVVLGVMAASELFNLKASERRLGRGPAFALVTAVLWGASFICLSQAFLRLDWQSASLVEFFVIGMVCTLLPPLLFKDEKPATSPDIRRAFTNKFVIGAGVIQMLGMVLINLGIEQDAHLAPIATAVSACYPVLTILLALTHFKESFKLVPMGGALLTITGVVLLSFG